MIRVDNFLHVSVELLCRQRIESFLGYIIGSEAPQILASILAVICTVSIGTYSRSSEL